MALIKCPECGNNVSSMAEMCPVCGYPICENPDEQMDAFVKKIVLEHEITSEESSTPMPTYKAKTGPVEKTDLSENKEKSEHVKNKKIALPFFAIIGIFIVLALGTFFFVFRANLFTKLFHKHEWREASCLKPKYCTICLLEEGDALGHNWVEATCTEARHCRRCMEEDGEVLPHTVEVGVCDICDEFQGIDLVQTILNDLRTTSSKVSSSFTVASDMLNNLSPYLMSRNDLEQAIISSCIIVNTSLQEAKMKYKKCIVMCAGHEYLKELKQSLTTVANSIPNLQSNPSLDEAIRYKDEITIFSANNSAFKAVLDKYVDDLLLLSEK